MKSNKKKAKNVLLIIRELTDIRIIFGRRSKPIRLIIHGTGVVLIINKPSSYVVLRAEVIQL